MRGYHYYWKYWKPIESKSLDCVHEKDNPFDFFTIKVMDRDRGVTVEHLPIAEFKLQNSSMKVVLGLYQSSLRPVTVFCRKYKVG